MLARVESACKYFQLRREEILFYFLFFHVEIWKIIFFSSFRISFSSTIATQKFTLRLTRQTTNEQRFHWFIFWVFGWVFYNISIVKKENCLFGTVNIKGKWKTNQKNNNDNIFLFFFFARARNRLIFESMKIEELAKYNLSKKISKILAYDWNENLSRFTEKEKRY